MESDFESRLNCMGAATGQGFNAMTEEADKRGPLIRLLEDALALADEIEDGATGFLAALLAP